ncbi:MAG: alpha/beta hydrolase family protein [Spirochaetia bacterium]
MKKQTVFGILLLVTSFTVFAMGQKSLPEAPEHHELSIPSLVERTYSSTIQIEEETESVSGVNSYIASYQSEDSRIYSLFSVPEGPVPEEGFPVVIVAHGFIPPRQYSTVSSYRRIADIFSQNGYAVLKPDYRAHGNSQGETGSIYAFIHYAVDTMNLIAGLDTLENVNTDEVFIWGHSMGGDIALRTAVVMQEEIQAITLWGAVSEEFPESILHYWGRHSTIIAENIRESLEQEYNTKELARFSYHHFFERLDTGIMIHHGTEDEGAPFRWSIALSEDLEEAGIEHTFHQYPGEDHNFLNGSYNTVVQRDLDFFSSFLSE